MGQIYSHSVYSILDRLSSQCTSWTEANEMTCYHCGNILAFIKLLKIHNFFLNLVIILQAIFIISES